MISNNKKLPLNGFLLLPITPILNYRGVDRNPFQPSIIEDEIDLSSESGLGAGIWSLYPPGWRRDAYRIYEENLVPNGGDDLFVLSSLNAVQDIQKIIEPQLGSHEIVECGIFKIDDSSILTQKQKANFLGYDVAYPGGDFYSALLNGLGYHHTRNNILVKEYRSQVNEFGLFINAKVIPQYVQRFRELVPSEANSEFCVFMLTLL